MNKNRPEGAQKRQVSWFVTQVKPFFRQMSYKDEVESCTCYNTIVINISNTNFFQAWPSASCDKHDTSSPLKHSGPGLHGHACSQADPPGGCSSSSQDPDRHTFHHRIHPNDGCICYIQQYIQQEHIGTSSSKPHDSLRLHAKFQQSVATIEGSSIKLTKVCPESQPRK